MDAGKPPNLAAWPGVELTGVLGGGARAAVFAARRDDERLVVKVSARSASSLTWELDVLQALARAGVRVPSVKPTSDGHLQHHGVVVQSRLPGRPPRSNDDWRRVAVAINAVHQVTRGWPQRPNSASASQLLSSYSGADVDLAAMPPEVVALVRGCWRALLTHGIPAVQPEQQCVVHGDLGAGNVLVDDDAVAILDWDEARVDVPAFDLAALPDRAHDDPPAIGNGQLARVAALAWEVATCWAIEPDYARRRLSDLEHAAGAIP
jgi:Ser/Thr protein kinase RdoA (MazF antagonist)